ncbi:MAG: 16S rRNA processing protein RimM [Alphaproteobacteria bacterium]|nr:16S rRNA processing protein RimM [Alphaproteobacteria bacterium]
MGETGRDTRAQVCVGVVTGAHGLHGLVRVRPYTEVPEDISAYGPVSTGDGARSFELDVRNRTGKGQVLVHIAGVDDRSAAEELRGMELYVPRDRLPAADADEFYHADLIGLPVVSPDGNAIGSVRALYDFGGGDVLEIEQAAGGIATVPFTRAAVPEVDLETGRVVVDPDRLLRPGNDNREGALDDGD